MKVKAPCPKCNAQWTITVEKFSGGTPTKCDKCGHGYRIPLYCPECNKGAEVKTFMLMQDGIKGGDACTCLSRHQFTVPVTATEVYDKLESLAKAGPGGGVVSKYDQGTRRDSLPYEKLKKAVSGGYCTGVVLDWIRRSVLGNKYAYENAEGETSGPEFERMMLQTTKGALAQTQMAIEKQRAIRDRVDAAFDAWMEREMERYQGDEPRLWEKFQEILKALPIPREGPDEPIAAVKRKRSEAYELYQKEKAESDAHNQAAIARANVLKGSPVMQKFWKSFAVTMDGCLDALRRQRGKSGPPTGARYSGLTVAFAINQKEFSGIHQIAVELLDHVEFKTFRAASITVTPPVKDATSHTVGIVRQNIGDIYELFDPNFGVYRFSPASRLSEAFDYIFKTAYPHWLGGGTADNQHYEIGGKVGASYTIFESARGPAVPGVAPALPAVQSAKTPQQATGQI